MVGSGRFLIAGRFVAVAGLLTLVLAGVGLAMDLVSLSVLVSSSSSLEESDELSLSSLSMLFFAVTKRDVLGAGELEAVEFGTELTIVRSSWRVRADEKAGGGAGLLGADGFGCDAITVGTGAGLLAFAAAALVLGLGVGVAGVAMDALVTEDENGGGIELSAVEAGFF